MKKVMKGGLEYDAFSGWKRVLKYVGRAGFRKSMKRKWNKRFRKEGMTEIEKEQMEDEASFEIISNMNKEELGNFMIASTLDLGSVDKSAEELKQKFEGELK